MPRSVSQSRRATPRPAPADTPSSRLHPALRQPSRLPRHDAADVCQVRCINQSKVDLARAALPTPATLSGLTEFLRALGDLTRLQIICALGAEGVGELCVCDLATLVGVSDSAVSHSLRTLRQLGVVRYRKAGKIAYYAIDDAHVTALVRQGIKHLVTENRRN
ncbi:MAG: transcriptional regulator [Gemmatimonas sp.]|nr:transcriptional regulator [Gemmatimonas sp.]